MAKAKRATASPKKITAEVMEVDDKDTLPALELAPYVDKALDFEIRGNFEAVKAFLEQRRAEIAKMKFSLKDLETVQKYKKEAQGYRTMIAGCEKDTKTRYFNSPKDIFSGKVASLQAIVTDIESRADKILDAKEQKRVKDLTAVFDIYKADFQEKYALSPSYLAQVEYRKGYYNKTAKEAESKADIKAQFEELCKREQALISGEKQIRKACQVNPLLNVEGYVRLLGANELANVLDMIEDERVRLERVASEKSAPQAQEASPELVEDDRPTAEKIVIGVRGAAGELLTATDFPGKTKKMVLDITYPVDLGEALTAVFKELRKYDIVTKVHEESLFK